MLNCWAKFCNILIHWSIRMIRAKNYETVFKFVKVMPRILVASFFWTRCIRHQLRKHSKKRSNMHAPYISRNCIFVAVIRVYLHSYLCSWLQKTHLYCTRVRFDRSRSSEVDDFGTNRKREFDFLLVHHCDYGHILHRFWDRATYWLKIAYFCYPSVICRLWNFALKLIARKLESGGYLQWRPHDCSLSRFDMIPYCDGQTDGWTDGRNLS